MSGTIASVAPAMPTASPASMPAAGLPRLPDWAGQIGPSHAGGVVLVVLMLVMAVGLARVLGRRLDPRARAEARVFDRAGLDPIQRRVLRRAARRLEPTVPAVSLLLSERLLVEASSPEACPRADLAVLEAIRRRRFGRGLLAVDGRAEAERPRPTGAVSDVAVSPDAATSAAAAATAAARRQRAASLLAAAIEVRDRRGGSPPDADAPASGRPTPVAVGAGTAAGR
jgi:hypothetical protein